MTAAHSHDLAVEQSHKTISAANVLDAVEMLEFGPEMRAELTRELEGELPNSRLSDPERRDVNAERALVISPRHDDIHSIPRKPKE